MSIVARCSLLDGVLPAADCRVTVERSGLPNVYVDNAQKLIYLAPGTTIGFVGSIVTASHLLQGIIRQLPGRRSDPISLMRWIPRFFRHEFARSGCTGPVTFMVASAIRGRQNIVERAAVARLLHRIARESPIKRNWVPGILIKILDTPEKYTHIKLPGTSFGLLYVMRAPQFKRETKDPLQFVAIGSGESAVEEIHEAHDMIFAGEPGNLFIEAMHLSEAIQQFIKQKDLPTVGGLCPIVKVTGEKIEAFANSIEAPVGGTRIQLAYENDRWIQKNVTTGKEIPLLLPWEINSTSDRRDRRFDDLKDIRL